MNNLIGRAETVNALLNFAQELHENKKYESEFEVKWCAYVIREKIPPAEPKRGNWLKISPAGIYECSECHQNVMTGDIEAYRFCHHCGARMGK